MKETTEWAWELIPVVRENWNVSLSLRVQQGAGQNRIACSRIEFGPQRGPRKRIVEE